MTDESRFLSRQYANKLWRMMNLYKIKTKDGRLINWKPNFVQRIILRGLKASCDSLWNPVRPIRDIVIKYRQGGVSTFWLLWWLDEVIWNENIAVAVIAHKQEAIGYLFEIIRLAHETMPAEVKPRVGSDSVRELSFPDLRSKIMVSLEVRSTTLHALHVSEWCYIKDAKVHATIGAVPPTGHISGESTGNGIGGDGYETYTDAKHGNNGYRALFVPWYIQREYRIPLSGVKLKWSDEETRLAANAKAQWGFTIDDEQIAFRRQKKKEAKNLFGQEFPETEDDAFLASGSPFFDNAKLKALLDAEIAEGEDPAQEETDWTMWKLPVKGHRYVAGADPADEGKDYAYLKILDTTTREEVFRYRARVSATRFAEVCDRWGRLYFDALLGVEENNMGLAVLTKLDELLHYPNLYRRDRPKAKTRLLSGNTVNEEGNSRGKLGWRTDAKTKPLALAQLKAAVEGDFEDSVADFEPDYRIRDKVFFQEAFTFSDSDGKLEGQEGAHDDAVMSAAIAWQMALVAMRSRGTSEVLGSDGIRFGESRATFAEDGERRSARDDRRF